MDTPKGKLAGIAEKFERDPQICLIEMLETWLERVDPPATWAAIVDAVEFLGEEKLGKKTPRKVLNELTLHITKMVTMQF